MIPVPITSPITHASIDPLLFLYRKPERKAPKTWPVIASGGMPIRVILIAAVITALAKLYQGPRNTEQTTFTK